MSWRAWDQLIGRFRGGAASQSIRQCLDNLLAAGVNSRFELWNRFINANGVESLVEVGVYRGEFAEKILAGSPGIKRYYMIDPWRHLTDWNKPANTDDTTFQQYYRETLERTRFASKKISVLRGKTTEVVTRLPDNSLDLAYIDGDHTLKGISIDLINIYPKVRAGGCAAGDDFSPSIWQHPDNYEPTLVFPFAVYFAEAVSAVIYALPFNQFLIHKSTEQTFNFIDLTGKYRKLELREQLQRPITAED